MSLSAPQPATDGLVQVLVLLGAPRGTEPIAVMDLENRVSKRPWALPTLPSRQPVDFGFQRPDNDSQHTVVKADCGGPIPTRIWIAGGQNFWLSGVQSPEPGGAQGASVGMERGTLRRGCGVHAARTGRARRRAGHA